jgi:hypothetical protein
MTASSEVRNLWRTVAGVLVAAVASLLFTLLSVAAWTKFFSQLRTVAQVGQLVLFWLGGAILGTIGALYTPNSKTLQMTIGGGVVFLLLVKPYGFLEGTFFPFIPTLAAITYVAGVYIGHAIIGRRQAG